MALETAAFVNQLVPANPTDNDPEGQGAAQMRLIKSTLVSSFPNISGALQSSNAAIDGLVGGYHPANTATPNNGSFLVLPANGDTTAPAMLAGSSSGTTVAVMDPTGATVVSGINVDSTGLLTVLGPTPAAIVGTASIGSGHFWEGATPISFVGEVRMFWGQVANIPPGWQICDGTNGTPDFRGAFPIGAGGSLSPGATGGANSYVLSSAQLPNHTHGINDAGHIHGVNDPGHNHGVNDPGHIHGMFDELGGPGGNISGRYVTVGITSNLGGPKGTDSATTGISVQGAYSNISIQNGGTGISIQAAGGSAAVDNRPAFMALCFIMRVS